MTECEVKEKIGPQNWQKFQDFMAGQTVGMNEDGSTNYYACDVEKFVISLKRPLNSCEWD